MSGDYHQRFDGLPQARLAEVLTLVTASTHTARRRGLAKLDELPNTHALLIPRCFSVHTFGMCFPLDLIWLGKDGNQVRVDRGVPPSRIRTCMSARSVVETLGGQADAFLAAGVGEGHV